MQIAALEREVRLKLTERHGRLVSLTPAGRLLAGHGHTIVDLLSLAELEAVALRDGAAGSYRLAAFPSAARTFVADSWQTLLTNPEFGLRLELAELEPQDAVAALQRGEVELAVTHAYSNMPLPSAGDLAASRIASEMVWLAIHRDDELVAGQSSNPPDARSSAGPGDPAGWAAAPIDLRALAGRDWIVPHRRWTCYEMVQRACGLAGFEPRAVAEATDFAVILSLVNAGAGVALIPELTIAQLPENVVLHPLTAPVQRHNFVLTRKSTDTDPGLRRLRELLAAAARKVLPHALPTVPMR
jgi:DNA-binding transcriptional LysR family regulator